MVCGEFEPFATITVVRFTDIGELIQDGARPHVAYIDVVTRRYEPVKIDSEDSIREVLVRRNINHVQFWNWFKASWIDGTVSDPIDVCIVSRHTLLVRATSVLDCPGLSRVILEEAGPDTNTSERFMLSYRRRERVHGAAQGLRTPEGSDSEE